MISEQKTLDCPPGPTFPKHLPLATVTLTDTSQLYFDTSSIGQPPRLWRLVPVP